MSNFLRPILAAAVWVVILGGLWAYMQAKDYRLRQREQVETTIIAAAPGEFAVELTPTFDVESTDDGFNLEPPPSIAMTLNGQPFFSTTQPAPAGVPMRIGLDGKANQVKVGANEFYLEVATPTVDAFALGSDSPSVAAVTRGIRVRILRDEEEVANQTLWSEPGNVLRGDLDLRIE